MGVRFFGISRGLFRYAKQLVSHQVTLRVLARRGLYWRMWMAQNQTRLVA